MAEGVAADADAWRAPGLRKASPNTTRQMARNAMRSRFEDELIAALVAVAFLPTLWWAMRLAWRARRRKRRPMSFREVIETARGKKES